MRGVTKFSEISFRNLPFALDLNPASFGAMVLAFRKLKNLLIYRNLPR